MDISPLIKNYINNTGQITQRPSKRSRQEAIITYLAEQIPSDFTGTEKDVNTLLEQRHTFGDIALLRRELYVAWYLGRASDGSKYWKI